MRDFIESALRGLEAVWRDGFRYAKAGVMLGDFCQSVVAQFYMFSEQQLRLNADALMAPLAGINRSRKGNVWFAVQGYSDTLWLMKRQMLPPRFTTRLKDILTVK